MAGATRGAPGGFLAAHADRENGAVGTFPLSSGEPRSREAVRHEDARQRRLTVLQRTPVTDSLVRVTFGGDLAGFVSLGPADHVKALFATPDGPAVRDYTPSEYRPIGASSGPELDIDFVVHGDSGPASAWASSAGPGDELEIAGPRGSRLAPAGFPKALLIADGTAIAALRRWVRAFAGTTRAHAVLFGADEGLVRYLDDVEALAATPQLALTGRFDLLDVVRSQDVTADTFVWAAGEATALVPVRRWLKAEAGLPKQNLSLHGYWKRGVAGLDHHAPLDPADPD
jgi:NADPH-dependent ferric siderophore reductase